MNNFGAWLKNRWKTFLIILLAVMFVSKCNTANNYQRKYRKETKKVEMITDSMYTVCLQKDRTIDSLNAEIRVLETRLESSESQSRIYQRQNSNLNDRLKDVAKKSVNVNIENKSAESSPTK